MPRPGIIPRNEQREFKLSELFFSTTDNKGIVRYGNRVFSRIAGYSLNELTGKPHNIIRHPDMPRCAFKLVWDYLKQGKVVAAYVKNLAADGCYYWVMALIMPCESGYLSIRLKPSSDFFPIVRGAYNEILEAENRVEAQGGSRAQAMTAGAKTLVELLGGLGFASYDEFMWAAITAEMKLRESRRDNEDGASRVPSPDPSGERPRAEHEQRARMLSAYQHCKTLDGQMAGLFSKVDTFSHFGDEIAAKTRFILRLGEEIRLLSINAEVQSAKLGDTGATLSVVAAKLGEHSETGTGTISRLNKHLDELAPIISGLVFDSIISKLKIEMAAYFIGEILRHSDQGDAETDAPSDAQLQANIGLLIQSFLDTARGILSALDQLQHRLRQVDQEAGQMHKFIRTLSTINLAGKIETARSESAQAFTTIFEEVQGQTQRAESQIEGFIKLICENTTQLASVDELDALNERAFSQLQALV